MWQKKHGRANVSFTPFWLCFLLLLITTSCLPAFKEEPQSSEHSQSETLTTPDDWSSLLQKNAYPYNTPLPPLTPTILDGTYTKFESKDATPIPCKRCPDYMVEGGTWKLKLDRGTFRILHEPTGWRGLGSFTVSADRLVLFNDPKCPDLVGVYAWQHEAGTLILNTIEDTCAANLRGNNLENLPWLIEPGP